MGEAGGLEAREDVGDLHVWHWGQRLMGCQDNVFPRYCALVEEGRGYGRTYYSLEVKTPHQSLLSN